MWAVNDQVPGNDARSTAARVPHATGTTQLIVYEANLAPGDRLQVHLWYGFTDQVRADVYFQTRRVGRQRTDTAFLAYVSTATEAIVHLDNAIK